jgi:hypothetical protein
MAFTDPPSPTPQAGHETTDANVSGVFVFGAGLAVLTAAAGLVIWMLLGYLQESRVAVPSEYPTAFGQSDRLPPEPRLQSNPPNDLRELRAEEDKILSSYGWVDKDAGIVRIPIDRAMALVVERGLPARAPEQAP